MNEKKLKLLKAKKEKQKSAEDKSLLIRKLTEERRKDRESREKEAEAVIAHLEALGQLIGTKDNTQLVNELKKLDSLKSALDEINKSIKGQKFEFPDKTKVTNLSDLAKLLKQDVKITNVIDEKWQKDLSVKLKELTEGVKARIVNQTPEDFIPVRRVIKMGNIFVFDDSRQGGGGGGGSNVTGPFDTNEQNVLVPFEYDFIDLNYTSGNLTEVIFKTGGSGGTTVATLTLAYSSGVLNTVTRS